MGLYQDDGDDPADFSHVRTYPRRLGKSDSTSHVHKKLRANNISPLLSESSKWSTIRQEPEAPYYNETQASETKCIT
jgi:hypothetical protein